MSCDDYCCNHGCNQGRNCPARKTPAKSTERAIEEQAKTDRQAASSHADDTDELDSDIGEIVLDGIAAALIVWLVAFVFAPALAGYLSHMKG